MEEPLSWVRDKYRVVKYIIVENKAYFYPDVRPKKKKKKKELHDPCKTLFEKNENEEDYSKYYVM